MPSTRWEDSGFAIAVIGDRTDASGNSIDDVVPEELRLINTMLAEGYIDDSESFVVKHVAGNMQVRVGSGTARADRYVVAGRVDGQGNYLVRHEAGQKTINIDAASASGTRIDEIWLVVEDSAYEANGRSLPRLAYRKGDVGQGNPGPDASWQARSLLARVTVAANVTSITAGNISNQRPQSGIRDTLLNGVMGRVQTIENALGGVRVGEVVHAGGTGTINFNNIPNVYHTLRLVARTGFNEQGKFPVSLRVNADSTDSYENILVHETHTGSRSITNQEKSTSFHIGWYGNHMGIMDITFAAAQDGTRVTIMGEGFGRHSIGVGNREAYLNRYGGYFVGGPLTAIRLIPSAAANGFNNVSRFTLYGYR